jgi:hypothetical protein
MPGAIIAQAREARPIRARIAGTHPSEYSLYRLDIAGTITYDEFVCGALPPDLNRTLKEGGDVQMDDCCTSSVLASPQSGR